MRRHLSFIWRNSVRWAAVAFLMVSAVVLLPNVSLATALPFPTLAPPAFFWQSMGKSSGDSQVLSAYKDQLSNVIVEDVSGTVYKLLMDDLEGDKHQKFIMRIAGGQTVLVVHNIDLAPRLDSLEEGDRVSVKGEYEWNDRGGLIHWTHRDPSSRHEDGWIIHENVRYE